MLSYEQCFILFPSFLVLFSSFPFLLAFDVGGLGFEFCVFIAGWRHALRSEWPIIIIIIIIIIITFRSEWPFAIISRRPFPPARGFSLAGRNKYHC